MSLNNLASLHPFPARSGASTVACTSLAVSSTAVSPVAFADTVDLVEFQVRTDAVTYRTDGTAPTATVGISIPAGTTLTWSRSKFNQAQFIRVTNDAVVYACPLQV
jgi:hypothetical protein